MLLRLILLLLLPLTTLAQRYPIQATVTLTPPYSPYLTDLTAPGAQRMALYLHVTDPTLSDYTCKLRLTIEGVGITLRTRPSFQPIAIPLQGGVPQIFYGEDLIDYFNPNNLDFAGLSRSAFAQTNRLPEGVYRFSIEVLDYNRGTVVSNKATATAWIILNDPPLLNLPRTNTKLAVFDPTNIPFTWTPRHTASPNAAFSTEYIFRLFELPATSHELSATSSQLLSAANQAVLSQLPLYETTLAQSQLVYGPGEPALIPGRWYAWQVQAIDTEERDLFKNRGKSEVFVFQFGDSINMPGNVRKETANHQVISIRWDVPTQGDMPEQYRVLYKPTFNDHWYEDVTKERWHNIGYLKPNTTYDIKVRSEKGKQQSEYTTTIQAATTDESSKFQCGGEVNIQPIDLSAAPLPHLLPGDRIVLNDFSVLVIKATGSNGYFEGTGWAKIPAFNGASVKIKFNGKINMLYQVDGEGETISTGGNWASNLIDDMEKIGEERRKEEAKIAAAATLPVTITLTGEIAGVIVNPEGDIVVTKADGSTEIIAHPVDEKTKEKKTVVLIDDKGNTWTVNKDGDVSPGVNNNPGGTAPGAVSADSVDFIVRFVANAQQHYGFDSKEYEAGQYDRTEIQDTEYPIAWKSVETGRQDNVNAITDEDSFPAAIGFKTNSGENISQPAGSENEKQVVVTGKIAGGSESLTAYVKIQGEGDEQEQEIEVGKLNIVTYDKVREKVFIVPVNNAVAPQISAELNRIYGQAVAGWDVTIDEPFTIEEDYITGLDDGESGMLASFPQKMREFNRKFNRSRNIDKDAYYIFLVEGSGASRKGFMPFKRQFGFIYTDKLGSTPPATAIAHELGHGAFRLRHPQSEFGITMTDNLMHNTNGTTLRKYQWDNVHDPESMVGWFQEDSESELYDCPMWFSGECETVGKVLDAIKKGIAESKNMMITANGNSELIAENITLNDVIFNKIKIIRHKQTGESLVFNPAVYENHNEKITDVSGVIDFEKGILFREENTDKSISSSSLGTFKILLYENDADFDQKKKALIDYLFATDDWPENKIIIKVKRIRNNDHRTVGTINVDNGKIVGYTLELPKGTDTECQTTCTETRKADGLCKRIIKGIYKFEYTTWSTKTWAIGHSLRILDVPGRDGILIHRGVNAKIWSEGCILAMRNNPTTDNEDTPPSERMNDKDDSDDFCTEIADYVKNREVEIKEKFKISKVEKIIIITEEEIKD